LEDLEAKSVIEAALFAAGKVLSLNELSSLCGLPEQRTATLAEDLSGEYRSRKSGIEIKRLGEGFAMQVAPGLSTEVISVAPRELEAPLIRTLAIIAYKQPILQSKLAEIRGNKSYAHVRELEKMGLISREKHGRTKELSTTRAFADYFGLASCRPEHIRRAILKDQKLIGVTPMYESLALRLGLDFVVVNPYRPKDEDLERLHELDVLIAAPGYAERIRPHFSGQLIEAGVKTLSELKESAEQICCSCGGDVEPLAEEIDALLKHYRQRAAKARPVKPLSPMIEKLAHDLRISVQEGGTTAAPDHLDQEAKIMVPTHQSYDLDIVERLKQRSEKLLEGACQP
jgi:segregation and condensation protein B